MWIDAAVEEQSVVGFCMIIRHSQVAVREFLGLEDSCIGMIQQNPSDVRPGPPQEPKLSP